MELYRTVRGEAEAAQIIEKSRFITHVKPVESRGEADEFIASIKKEYKDATHNVPAMVLGDKFQIQWGSDDGEPQGTSGAPMVQMMVKEGLTNLAVVVTRYFGGIKLGTGGLVRAYTSSARLGIEAAGICSVEEICRIKLETEYSFLSKLQNISVDDITEKDDEKGAVFSIRDIGYTDKITLDIITYPETEDEIVKMLMDITAGNSRVLGSEKMLEKV